MAGPNDILALLMGGMTPTDPRAQFLGQNFTAGRLPGDPMSNMNTILDLLSPSATADYMDQFGGPPSIERTFGLDPNEAGSFIRQSLGMEISPVQQAGFQNKLMELIPQLLTAQAAQTTAGARVEEAGAASRNAATNEKEAQTKADTEARLREQFENGTPQDKATMYEMNLKNMALSGKMLDGTPVDKTTRQNAFTILRGVQAQPGLSALVAELAKGGEWEAAGRLVGLPPESIQKSWWPWARVKVSDTVTGVANDNFGQTATGPSGTPEGQVDAMVGAWGGNFLALLDKLAEQQRQQQGQQ